MKRFCVPFPLYTKKGQFVKVENDIAFTEKLVVLVGAENYVIYRSEARRTNIITGFRWRILSLRENGARYRGWRQIRP